MARWVFDHPFHIILNLAVGGDWPGPATKDTAFPQEMSIDYVRVYKRDGKRPDGDVRAQSACADRSSIASDEHL